MTITTEQLTTITGSNGNVVSTGGDKIGSIGQVYVDDTTSEPTWVTAKTGLFGTAESFVPLQGATVQGNDIVVNYDKHTVKDAPRVDADGALSPEEEETLYSHYGLSTGGTSNYSDSDSTTGTGFTSGTGTVGNDRDNDRDRDNDGDRDGGLLDKAKAKLGRDNDGDDNDRDNVHGTTGYDTSGPTTDNAMTLSEEQLNVGVQRRESGRARLRKYVVTENVTQTIPVSHEEVRVEREPITDANRGSAMEGPAISEEEHEVILHEERPVVEKEAVPVERVRLDTETVTSEQTVTDEVRKERVDTDVDGDNNTRR